MIGAGPDTGEFGHQIAIGHIGLPGNSLRYSAIGVTYLSRNIDCFYAIVTTGNGIGKTDGMGIDELLFRRSAIPR